MHAEKGLSLGNKLQNYTDIGELHVGSLPALHWLAHHLMKAWTKLKCKRPKRNIYLALYNVFHCIALV